MSPAGARRNRKNAVELNVPEYDEPRTNGRGRPSKGGELVRAHRYYAKKHMLILQKRRLKRYTDKVKKILEECDYDSRNVSKAIDDAFKKNTKIRKIFKKKDLLISANLIRDDRYLHFLNQHEQEHINELFANDSEKTSIPDQVPVDAEQLLQKHSVAAMTFSALVSAFLLTKYIETTAIESATTLEKKQACLTLYKTSYNHLTGDSQGSERRPSRQFAEVKLEPVDITWPEEVEQDNQSNREFTGEESQEEESKVGKNCESEENSSKGEESEVDSQSEESEDENDSQSKDSEGKKNSQSTSSSSSSSGRSDGESEEESSRKKRRVSP